MFSCYSSNFNLLSNDSKYHAGDEFKMFHALSHGHISTIKRLILNNRVSVQCVDTRNGWPTLFYAIRFGYNDLVEFLLDNKHEKSGISKDILNNTAVIIAILFDNDAAFDMYVSRYPQAIHLKNKFGESPLHLAAKKGNNEIIIKLLKLQANIDDIDNEGSTPLHYATAWAHEDTINLLIGNGCNFTISNAKGWTATDFAFSDKCMQNINLALGYHEHESSIYGNNEIVQEHLKLQK